jgi:hypothetical protein
MREGQGECDITAACMRDRVSVALTIACVRDRVSDVTVACVRDRVNVTLQ